MQSWRSLVPVLFLPAGLGLLMEISAAATTAERVLAAAIALFCPELARMAWVDLSNVAAVTQQTEQVAEQMAEQMAEQARDSRLNRFHAVVISTIVLEITGFYLAMLSLPGGAIAVIFSQLWFNLLADIQLYPGQTPAIVPFGRADRRAVLIANGIGLGLLGLWFWQEIRIWLASGLFLLIIIFLLIKYVVPQIKLTQTDR